MNELENKDDKIFSCGCREWTLKPNDLTNHDPDDNYFLYHDCAKIKVYQRKKSMERLFIKK